MEDIKRVHILRKAYSDILDLVSRDIERPVSIAEFIKLSKSIKLLHTYGLNNLYNSTLMIIADAVNYEEI